jgi:malonyl-CoA O-methyltransferase
LTAGKDGTFRLHNASIDLAAVRRNFRRVAATCGEADFLSREIDSRMQERLDYVRLAPAVILDSGCGPGFSLSGLQARYPKARCLGLDQEWAMLPHPSPLKEGGLAIPSPLFLAAQAEHLPLRGQSVDLFWSNLLLPWLADPAVFFQEALRCLKVEGLLMFSTLGPDTLKELRGGFQDGFIHTQHFFDLHDLGDMLLAAGFADPVMDMEILTLTYADLDALIADIRASGAVCAMRERRRGLAGRNFRQNLERHYEALRREGRLPATLEILYGHAWKPQPQKNEKGEALIHFR